MSIEAIVKLLRNSKQVVVFTGAGASAESGIPTFRGALTGLWERFDAAQLATEDAYRSDPSLCWGWYEWRRIKGIQAQPNPVHYGIEELSQHVPGLTVVTQNVDDLHERAGSKDVIHLHGSLHSPRCIKCATPYSGVLPSDPLPGGGCRIKPPQCDVCGGNIRPGVVWFGEILPESPWVQALAAVENCDLFLSIGTSGTVYPAAELPLRALKARATVVHINPLSSPISEQEYFLKGSAATHLPNLVSIAFGGRK